MTRIRKAKNRMMGTRTKSTDFFWKCMKFLLCLYYKLVRDIPNTLLETSVLICSPENLKLNPDINGLLHPQKENSACPYLTD